VTATPPPAAGTARPAGPRSPTEQAVAGVWREVLGLATVGVHDNFFDVGGTSFALAAVRSGLKAVLGRDLRLVDLFLYPTVRALGEFLDGSTVDGDLDRVAARVAQRRERSRRRTNRVAANRTQGERDATQPQVRAEQDGIKHTVTTRVNSGEAD
ncbi:phosphopantetheine-binding protein, partial [Actinophytocola sp.]|uniref:phosphopantetheine-binding protein n=1 Tax=Actinophytocola sp. TaxID=1872138 RepID=UPI003D6B73F9